MGAGSSSSSQLSKGGIIDVGDTKNKVVRTIDLLFQQLLSSTNPINFKQALEATGNKTCSGILVLLQPTIEKEFQQMAFQDPETKQIVQSMFKGYESIEDFSSTILTKTLCKEITLFFLRLIILLGTCIISIRPNKSLTGLLGTIGSSFVEQSDAFQGIVKIKTDGLAPATSLAEGAERKPDEKSDKKVKIFDSLPRDSKDIQLKSLIKNLLIKEKDINSIIKKQAGDYYVVVGPDSKEYVFDLYNLFVYQNQQNTARKVGVISLSGALRDPVEAIKPRVGGTRSNRSKAARRTRKQRGGDPTNSINISGIKRKGQIAQYYYMFNRTDEKCNNAKPIRLSCSSSSEYYITTEDTPTQFVNDVIKYYLSVFSGNEYSKTQTDKYGATIEPIQGTGSKVTGYGPLTLDEKATYARLQNLLETGDVSKLEEGTCLAVYRAYLLASGLINTDKGQELKTYVCHDKWAEKTKRLADVPLFALLDQLYKDRLGVEMEPGTKNKYELFIDRLEQTKTVGFINGSTKAIENLQFVPFHKDSERCKNKLSGLDTVTDAGQIGNIMNEYKSISNELVKLIDGITKIIDKILDFKLFIDEKRIKLRPIFMTDKRGAQIVLTEFTESVRTLLEDHIVSVESSYYNGVAVLGGITHASILTDIKHDDNTLATALAV
jgi:hypothetical protein